MLYIFSRIYTHSEFSVCVVHVLFKDREVVPSVHAGYFTYVSK